MISKKAQVDVALTIGSIIIPVAVLFGALIFAWAMISPVTDAGRTAGLVIYDMGAMTDIAYSVPDSIRIVYTPPSMCSMAKDIQGASVISCFNGFMNLSSDINLKTNASYVEFPILNDKGEVVRGTRKIPFEIIVQSSITFSEQMTQAMSIKKQPIILTYSSFANLNDIDLLIQSNNENGVSLTTDKGIVFEKRRSGFEDTIVPESIADYDKDPLAEIVSNSAEVCSTGSTITKNVYLKTGFYLRTSASNSNELCLYKAMIFPDVTYYMTGPLASATIKTNLYCGDESHTPGAGFSIESYDYLVYGNSLGGDSYIENKISCFDFSQIPGQCAYDMSYWGSSNPAYDPPVTGTHIKFDIAKTGSTINYTERTG